MKLASAIEGGLAGASTLTLLQEALHKIDRKSPRPFLHKTGILKHFKKGPGKKGYSSKLLITLAGELLASTAYFGLSALGKKRNAVLRGGLLGAGAGLGAAFLDTDDHKAVKKNGMHITPEEKKDELKKKLLTITLYTAGGVLAGMAVKKLNGKTKKGKKRK
jgi:hypothetical protein